MSYQLSAVRGQQTNPPTSPFIKGGQEGDLLKRGLRRDRENVIQLALRITHYALRTTLFALVMLLIQTAPLHAAAYDRGHVYIGGRVDYISGNSITVSGVDYTIDSTCKVVITYKERDSFHERPARLSDVRRGDPVYVKKIGTVLYEINIEGWKR